MVSKRHHPSCPEISKLVFSLEPELPHPRTRTESALNFCPCGRAAEAELRPWPRLWSARPSPFPGRASPSCRAPPGERETDRPGERPGPQVGTSFVIVIIGASFPGYRESVQVFLQNC